MGLKKQRGLHSSHIVKVKMENFLVVDPHIVLSLSEVPTKTCCGQAADVTVNRIQGTPYLNLKPNG